MMAIYPEFFYYDIYDKDDNGFLGCVRVEFIPMNRVHPSIRACNVASAKYGGEYEDFDAVACTKEKWEQNKIDPWQV